MSKSELQRTLVMARDWQQMALREALSDNLSIRESQAKLAESKRYALLIGTIEALAGIAR